MSDSTPGPTLIQGDDFEIVPSWIHNIRRSKMQLGKEGMKLEGKNLRYNGWYSLPIPGIDVHKIVMSDYEDATMLAWDRSSDLLEMYTLKHVIERDGHGLIVAVWGTGTEYPAITVWCDEQRPNLDPSRDTVCILTNKNKVAQYLPVPGSIGAAFQAISDQINSLWEDIGVSEDSISNTLRELHNSADLKDTYKPGGYLAANGDYAVKSDGESNMEWTLYKPNVIYTCLSFNEVVEMVGIDNFPLKHGNKDNK